jgi:hypothetical protein
VNSEPCLAVAEGLGGDPAEGSLSVVVGIDDDRALGDVDREDSVGVGLAQGEFLTGDHEEIGVRSRRWTVTGGARRTDRRVVARAVSDEAGKLPVPEG